MRTMSREKRLAKVLELAKEMTNNYTWDKYCEMLDLCDDDIFYSDGDNNDFYIEDEHFIYND